MWEDAGELHYMGYKERRDFPSGPWDESPGIFLPEKVLNICFRVLPTPSQAVMTSVAFLAWVSLDEASSYFSTMHKKLQDQKEEDLQRETWKLHPLYQESRETLVKMCSESGLLTTGKKHELVQRIAKNETHKKDLVKLDKSELYDGDMESIPSSSPGLMRLSVAQLRLILRTHRVLEVGTKEELVTSVGLLKAGYPEAAFSREHLCILHIMEVAQQITKAQYELNMRTVRRRRKFGHGQENTLTTRTSCLKDVLSQKTPFIDVDSGQKRNVQSALESLRVIVAEKEESSRLGIDEQEQRSSKINDGGESKTVKKSKAKKDKVLKSEGDQKGMERPQRRK